MKINGNSIEYHSGEPGMAHVLSVRLSENLEHSGAALYHSVGCGRTEPLDSSDSYRLFFLLKGRVRLNGGGYDNYPVYEKEFILLPPRTAIACRTEEDSRYVLLGCTGLKSKGNVACYERLKERSDADGGSISCLTLPIRERLDGVLNSFAAYPVERSQHQAIFDAVFILLRVLYTEEELLLMLHPMLREKAV